MTNFTALERKRLQQFAKQHRKAPTKAEALLWQKLRCKRLCGVRFLRQRVKLSQYILDFYCHMARLAIEVDGSAHDALRDKARDGHLRHYGILTLRFRNEEVLTHLSDVTLKIREAVLDRCAIQNTGNAGANGAGPAKRNT